MRIISTAALNTKHIAEIEKLHADCAAHDGAVHRLNLDTGMNLDPQMPAYFMGYDGEEMTGILIVYHGDETEAEITGFTSPRYRRRGVFKALLDQVSALLRTRGVRRLLLQCNPAVVSGPAAMAAMGMGVDFSEYIMVRKLDALSETDSRLQLHAAKPCELDAVCALAGGIFDDDQASYRAFLTKALAAADMSVYTAQLGGDTVGLGRMIWSEQPPYLCTFGILPDWRGRGLGEALLHGLLVQAADRGHDAVTLDVNSGNTAAVALYRKAGFQVQAQIDYYDYML